MDRKIIISGIATCVLILCFIIFLMFFQPNKPTPILEDEIPKDSIPVASVEVPITEEPNKTIDKYQVVLGDCLWYISDRFYNDPYKWRMIYKANKSIIKNPDLIYPSQVFVIPTL